MADPVRIRVSIPGRGQITTFDYETLVPSATWNIIHNLGRFPQVTAFDADGDQIIGSISYPSQNTLTISFNIPVSGTAHLT